MHMRALLQEQEQINFTLQDVLWESVVVIVLLIPLGLSIWSLLDAVHRPRWVWALSGRRQLVWLILIIMGVITMIVGLFVAGYYLAIVRPELRSIEAGDMTQFEPPPS